MELNDSCVQESCTTVGHTKERFCNGAEYIYLLEVHNLLSSRSIAFSTAVISLSVPIAIHPTVMRSRAFLTAESGGKDVM